LPEIDKAEQLLKTLVKDFPNVADYRFELADTYAMIDVRDLPPDDFPRASSVCGQRWNRADLVTATPTPPTICFCTSTFA